MYLNGYDLWVYQLQQTDTFARWLRRLRDARSKARILARLESARLGGLGDCKAVGSGVREMRIHTGGGYRVYFVQREKILLILLCGGSKSSQSTDIRRAKQLAKEIED